MAVNELIEFVLLPNVMIGFLHSRHADVNLITDNLRDRYKDLFSILKELAQNADDAGAEQLRFGIAPGNSEALHELLRGPGLVVVNDGVFRHSDNEAICSFGPNIKAGDGLTVIGRRSTNGRRPLIVGSLIDWLWADSLSSGGAGKSIRNGQKAFATCYGLAEASLFAVV